jgi:hypothetical protein
VKTPLVGIVATLMFSTIAASPLAAPSGAGLAFDTVSTTLTEKRSGVQPTPQPFASAFAVGAVPEYARIPKTVRDRQPDGPTVVAYRYYIGTTKYRFDDLLFGDATISDRVARTTTRLQFYLKMYSVKSFDEPIPTPEPDAFPQHDRQLGPPAKREKQRVRITGHAVDPIDIDGISTPGFAVDTTQLYGRIGTPAITREDVTYYSAIPRPAVPCADPRNPWMDIEPAGDDRDVLSRTAAEMRRHLAQANVLGDVTSSGPTFAGTGLPVWGYFAGIKPDGGAVYLWTFQVGHIRPITDADDAFDVPARYRKVAEIPTSYTIR